MVEYTAQERIALIKRLLEEKKKEEETLEKEERELKKKEEELRRKKEEARKKQEEVEDALEDALDAESEEFQRSFRRTDVQLDQPRRIEETATPRSEKKEEQEEFSEPKDEEPELRYRRMPQAPTASDVYKRLENLYQQIPIKNPSPSVAQQAQREIYHELKSMATHWGTQKPEVNVDVAPKAYGREIVVNPHSEASTWDRLSDRVRAMAEQAGTDKYNYQQRTEIVLNQLRRNFEERQYISDKKDEFRELL